MTKQSSLKVSLGVMIASMYDSPEISPIKRAESTASRMRFLLYRAYTMIHGVISTTRIMVW